MKEIIICDKCNGIGVVSEPAERNAKLAASAPELQTRVKELEAENQRLTADVERLKEAAKELVHLHGCEQEGLSSGRPTAAQWLQAVDNLSNLVYP